jgi:catalase
VPPTPEALVDAITAVTGVHPGYRVAHAKGVCAAGTFTGTPEAAGLSRAAHFGGGPVPATVRFSNGSGRPDQADGVRDGRGIAVKLRLPDDTSTDMVGLTLPVFFVRTPEDFLVFMEARVPDPATGEPDLAKVGEFLAAHPEAVPAVEAALTAPAPASYAQCTYHGVHAFRYVDVDGNGRYGRYRWEPNGGVATISDEEAGTRPPDYLRDELTERLARDPALFTLVITLAGAGDDPDDPTVAWPADRPSIVAGQLELTEAVTDPSADALIFDPTRVVDGIECSADPILHARSGAYGVSYARRTAVPSS